MSGDKRPDVVVPAAPTRAGRIPAWLDYGIIPLVNVAAAFIIAGFAVLLIGENPFLAIKVLIAGPLGSPRGLAYTLFYATSFIMTGLSVAVAFHAGLFNIGSEGQAYLGGLGVGLVAITFDAVLPWYLLFPLAIIAASLFGAGWAFIPAWLQAKRGSHVVITTILFNLIASAVMVWLLVDHLSAPGSMEPQTQTFEAGGRIPDLSGIFALFGATLRSPPVNISLFLALVAAALVYILIWRTKLGYEMRAFGLNPTAALYAGISPTRIILIAMLISGALAGLMSINVVLGEQQRLSVNFVQGAGFIGIAVALMGRSHPFGIVLAALLFGVLYQGGSDLQYEMSEVPRELIVLIQGLVILFAGALENLFRPGVVRGYNLIFPERRPPAVPVRVET